MYTRLRLHTVFLAQQLQCIDACSDICYIQTLLCSTARVGVVSLLAGWLALPRVALNKVKAQKHCSLPQYLVHA